MSLWYQMRGTVLFEVISADPMAYLSGVAGEGVELQNVSFADPLTINALVCADDCRICRKVAAKRGERFKIIQKLGVYWHFKRLLHRPVLLCGLGLIMLAALTVPRRILLVRVEGNAVLPDRYILQMAEGCGIGFGANRGDVRSERIKNKMLERIPQLQWVGVNTKGCVATITVREKNNTQSQKVHSEGVGSIVATQSGIVKEIAGVKGNVVCKPGQAVGKGQVLISGYTDCGLSIRATRAEGEVYAQTLHDLNTITMSNCSKRTKITRRETRYSLKIGKNLIKLYNGSGISPAGCVKMYTQRNLSLPGDFVLPVVLIEEELIFYDTEPVQLTAEDAGWLAEAATGYLTSQMVAGQILSKETDLTTAEGVLALQGRYDCYEMISELVNEEIILPNGENE